MAPANSATSSNQGTRPNLRLVWVDVTAVTGCDTGVQQRLRFSDPFGDRRPRLVDVRPGPRVATIQEQHPCPDVDSALQLSPNVVIATRQKQLFNFDRVIGALDSSH